MENEKQEKRKKPHFVYRYATLRDCKYFMVFALDLPFSLPIKKPFHEMIIDKLSFLPFKDERRFVAFYSEQKWSEYVETPGREIVSAKLSQGNPTDSDAIYKSLLTKLKVLIEIKDSEVNSVKEQFHDKSFRSQLLVRIMSILEYKLIEIMGFDFGAEHINYGAERVSLYEIDNDVDVIKPLDGPATSDYSAKGSSQIKHGSFDNMLCDDVCVWRYYANKCEIDYYNGKHLDCILSAAMAIESYIHYLLVQNNLLEKFNALLSQKNYLDELINKYNANSITSDEFVNACIQEKEKKHYSNSVFSEVDYLYENGAIDKSTQSLIKKLYGEIRDNRNDIAHGNIESLLFEETAAQKAYNAIIKLFSSIPYDAPKRVQEDFISQEDRMARADAFMRNNNYTEAFPILLDNMKRKVYFSLSSYYLGVIYYHQKEYGVAKKLFKICYEKKRFLFQSTCYLAFIAQKEGDRPAFVSYKDEALNLYDAAQKDTKRSPDYLSFYHSFYIALKELE